MFVLKPLARRPIALLWGGQVLSSIGDELHKVALVWLAAGILGLNTGYISALQAGGVFIVSIFGGIWANRWDHGRTMIGVDLVRGGVVLLLPLASYFGPARLWILIPVAVVVSSLNALFSPALRATVPELAPEPALRQATNGLMETTGRLARVIGPGIIGVLNARIPLIHFFTVDAVSFLISAASIARLGPRAATAEKKIDRNRPREAFVDTLKEGVFGGYRALAAHPLMKYLILSNSVVNSAWYLVFPLALGLQLHAKMPNNVGALGWVISAYGVGNVLSNLVAGSLRTSTPAVLSFLGRLVVGIGFVGLAFAPNLRWTMISACFAATGGPMTDLSFLALLQRDFKTKDIAKIYRFDMAVSYGALFICFLVSPLMFKAFSIPYVIAGCGAAMMSVSLVGIASFGF